MERAWYRPAQLAIALLLLGLCTACSREPDYEAITAMFRSNRVLFADEVEKASKFAPAGKCLQRGPNADSPLKHIGVLKIEHCQELFTLQKTTETFTNFDVAYSGLSISGCVTRIVHQEVGPAPVSEKWEGGFIDRRIIDNGWFIERTCN